MTFPLYATSPLPYAVVLPGVLAVTWCYLPRYARYVGIVAEVLLVAMMTPLGAAALERAAASTELPECNAPDPRTVVVLGAGYAHMPTGVDDFGALRLLGLQRLFGGVALWRDIKGAVFVVTGGAGARIPEAVPLARLAERMGVPSADIRIEDRSHTTWENARNVAEMSPPVSRRIWLVTSAMHIPRALTAFRAYGFHPCAWPVARTGNRLHVGFHSFVPQGLAVFTATIAWHELLGRVDYRVRAWRRSRRVDVERRRNDVHSNGTATHGVAPGPAAPS